MYTHNTWYCVCLAFIRNFLRPNAINIKAQTHRKICLKVDACWMLNIFQRAKQFDKQKWLNSNQMYCTRSCDCKWYEIWKWYQCIFCVCMHVKVNRVIKVKSAECALARLQVALTTESRECFKNQISLSTMSMCFTWMNPSESYLTPSRDIKSDRKQP